MQRIHFKRHCLLYILLLAILTGAGLSCTKSADAGKKKPRLTAKVGTQTLICPEELIEQGLVIRIYDDISQGITGVQFNFVDPDLKMGFIINNYFSKSTRSNETVVTDIDDAANLPNWGVGQLNTNIDAGISGSKYYQSHRTQRGRFVITNVDEANKTMSGYFQFNVYQINNPNTGNVNLLPGGGIYAVSGEFENIPLSDGYAAFFANTSGGTGTGTGTGSGGAGATAVSVVYKNTSFTNMKITVNNQTQTVAPGVSASFTGTANSNYTGSATTSGATSGGTQVGLALSWTLSGNFPASGSKTTDIVVPSTYFYLRIINQSSYPILKVYVNYGYTDQSVDNITLATGGQTYGLGYYKAFSNSNVRGENGTRYWQWSTLNLPFTNGQSVTVTAN